MSQNVLDRPSAWWPLGQMQVASGGVAREKPEQCVSLGKIRGREGHRHLQTRAHEG